MALWPKVKKLLKQTYDRGSHSTDTRAQSTLCHRTKIGILP